MDKFFGSKLNTVLLLVLIVLMAVTIIFIVKNKICINPFGCTYMNYEKEEKLPIQEAVAQISGNKDDLISFSILPGTKVHGVVSYNGVIKGGYFFEANILINVLDANKNVLKKSNAMAKGEWMTSGPVSFEGNIDFTGLPIGPAFFEIHNDNPSDMRENDKSVLIPIVIE